MPGDRRVAVAERLEKPDLAALDRDEARHHHIGQEGRNA